MPLPTLYEVLDLNASDFANIPENEIFQRVKSRYKTLARIWHPDMCKDKNKLAEATEKFKLISLAHEILGDSLKRAEYNRNLRENPNNSPFTQNPVFTNAYYAWNSNESAKKPSEHTFADVEKHANECNAKLQTAFDVQRRKIYNDAFTEYQKDLNKHYKTYQNKKYATYTEAYEDKKQREQATIEAQFQQEKQSAKTKIIVGLVTFFLVIPLGVAVWGWMQSRSLPAKKQAALDKQQNDQGPKLTQAAYNESVDSNRHKVVLSEDQWKQKEAIPTVKDFMNPNTSCDAAKKAQAEARDQEIIFNNKVKENTTLKMRTDPKYKNIFKGGPLRYDDAYDAMTDKLSDQAENNSQIILAPQSAFRPQPATASR